MRHLGILAIVLALAALMSAHGEALAAWGVKGGLSLAGQEFDPLPEDIDIEGRAGLYAAIYGVPIGMGPVRLVTELGYAQKGMTSVESGRNAGRPDRATEKHDNRLDYLSLAVFGEISLFGGPIKPYVALGPRVDVLLGQDVSDFFASLYDDSGSVDFGGDIAAGVRLANLALEARYSMVFDDSFKDESLEVKNSTVLLLVGIEF